MDQQNKDSGVRGTTPAIGSSETLRAAPTDGQRCVRCGEEVATANYGPPINSSHQYHVATNLVQCADGVLPIAAPEAEGVEPTVEWLKKVYSMGMSEGSVVPQRNAGEMLARLDELGFGKQEPRRGNTLWAMVMDAADEVESLRQQIESTRVSSDAKPADSKFDLVAEFKRICAGECITDDISRHQEVFSAIIRALANTRADSDAKLREQYERGLEDALDVVETKRATVTVGKVRPENQSEYERKQVAAAIRALISQRTGVVNSELNHEEENTNAKG